MVLINLISYTSNNIQFILVLIFLVFYSLGYAEVLPINKQQKIVKTVSSPIKKCDFHKLGTWGFQVFVGIELDASKAPYIRFNIPHTERTQYETWCKKKSDVTIRYRIKHTKGKSETTYWAEDIKENKNKTSD